MRAVLIIGALLFLCSCQEPYEKAVKQYVQDNFYDPSSYECVELSDVQEMTVIVYGMEKVRERGKQEGWSADSIDNKMLGLRPFFIEQGDDPDKVLFRYVDHKYRANNAMGAKTLHKERWYLNDDLTSVIKTEPK